MLVHATSKFKEWSSANPMHPINQLWITRQSFECKSVLLWADPQYEYQKKQYQPLEVMYIPGNILQQLIMVGAALLMTPAMNTVLDFLASWVLSYSMDWYFECLAVLADAAKDGIAAPFNDKKEIWFKCIEALVLKHIHIHYGNGSDQAYWIWVDWKNHFDTMYKQNPNWHFRTMTLDSEQHVFTCIVHVGNFGI